MFICLVCFYDAIQTIIKYEKKNSSGGSTLKISIEWGSILDGSPNFFSRRSCIKSSRGVFSGTGASQETMDLQKGTLFNYQSQLGFRVSPGIKGIVK